MILVAQGARRWLLRGTAGARFSPLILAGCRTPGVFCRPLQRSRTIVATEAYSCRAER